MNIKESFVISEFFRQYTGTGYLCNNIFTSENECDILLITDAKYSTEFEIKITKSDFLADKKKELKHKKLIAGHSHNYFYYVLNECILSDTTLSEINEKYGVITFCLANDAIRFKYVRYPKKLKKEPQSDKFYNHFLKMCYLRFYKLFITK